MFSKNLCIFLVGLILLASISCWYVVHDWSDCNVISGTPNLGSAASVVDVDGYYTTLNGYYFKNQAVRQRYFPDLFNILAERFLIDQKFAITLGDSQWIVWGGEKALYRSKTEYPERFVFQPPDSGWVSVSQNPQTSSTVPILRIQCKGSILNSRQSPSQSNIADLLNRPVTTFIFVFLCATAYYLWANRVNPSAVSFSYATFIHDHEYWRLITASISHFELFHLGLNTIGTWQFGSLETAYGSAKYAYLSVDLIFITILIVVAISHYLIASGRTDFAHQSAVGYSCVLFAWMVAASVRMKEFCPVFLFPKFCFSTWTIPLPFSLPGISSYFHGLPVNIGPILLLFLTKLIIPNSSMLGHGAGVIIGYPLAWNMLDWLTPPIFFPLVASAMIVAGYSGRLKFWRYAGFELAVSMRDVLSANATQLARFNAVYAFAALSVLVNIVALLIFNPWQQVPHRILAVFLTYGAVQSCRALIFCDLRTAQEDCILFIFLYVSYVIGGMIYDFLTLAAALGASSWLHYSCGLSVLYMSSCFVVLAASAVLSSCVCLAVLFFVPDNILSGVAGRAPSPASDPSSFLSFGSPAQCLQRLKADASAAKVEVLKCLRLSSPSSTLAFSGTGNSLQSSTTSAVSVTNNAVGSTIAPSKFSSTSAGASIEETASTADSSLVIGKVIDV